MFVVDDHPLTRGGIVHLLETTDDLLVVGQASSGEAVLDLADGPDEGPDVLLVDLRMPDLDGLEITRRLTEKHSNVRVVILTAHDDDRMASEAALAGARAYVLKTAEGEELVETVRMVANGHAVFDTSVLRALAHESSAPAVETMSAREREVLLLLARGLKNRQIAEELELSPETVKTHIERLFRRLGASDRTDAVARALRSGVIS